MLNILQIISCNNGTELSSLGSGNTFVWGCLIWFHCFYFDCRIPTRKILL